MIICKLVAAHDRKMKSETHYGAGGAGRNLDGDEQSKVAIKHARDVLLCLAMLTEAELASDVCQVIRSRRLETTNKESDVVDFVPTILSAIAEIRTGTWYDLEPWEGEDLAKLKDALELVEEAVIQSQAQGK